MIPIVEAFAFIMSVLFVALYSKEFKLKGSPEGRLFKGNRNAIYLVQNGQKRLIPDFYTFSKMGFNLTSIEKVPDDYLLEIPLGVAIKPIPVFRPEDYMYHKNCEDPDRMVQN